MVKLSNKLEKFWEFGQGRMPMPGCSSWTSSRTANEARARPKVSDSVESSLESISDESDVNLVRAARGSLQPTIAKSFQTITSYKAGGSMHSKITEAIVYYICKDNQPFRTVEGEGFKHLLKEISPLYRPPSRELIKRRIDHKYDILSKNFKTLISQVEHISLTTDMWTEIMTVASYLGITIHFINESKLKSGTLGVFPLYESHTSAYIASQIQNILSEWGDLFPKVCCVVTDNGANIVRAIHDTFSPNKHLPCAAHTIILVAECAVKNTEGLPQLLSKIREVVKWIKRSSLNTDSLNKKQIAKGKVDGTVLKVILDVATRWNSVFYMTERFLELSSFINELLLENASAPDTVSAHEINILKEVIALLRPLEKFTTELSGQNYTTVSKVIPMVSCIKESLKNLKAEREIGLSLRNNILQEINKRFGKSEQNHILATATILDPRFKTIHFLDPIACSKAINFIRKEIVTFDGPTALVEEESCNTDEANTFDLWNHHKQLAKKKKNNKMSPGIAQDELSMYLSMSVSDLSKDPLETWENLKNVFPGLYSLSRRYLHNMATSVPAEQLFSKAGATATKTRNRLSGKRLSKLLFLSSLERKDWLL